MDHLPPPVVPPPPPPRPPPQKSNVRATLLAMATVLIPLFLFTYCTITVINHEQEKRRRASAKAQTPVDVTEHLKRLADLERRYRKMHGHYTTDLKTLDPNKIGVVGLYKYGFTTADQVSLAKGVDPRRKDTEALGQTLPDLGKNFDELAKIYCAECTATRSTFKIVAIGNLDKDERFDVWTIDHNKKLVNVENDVDRTIEAGTDTDADDPLAPPPPPPEAPDEAD